MRPCILGSIYVVVCHIESMYKSSDIHIIYITPIKGCLFEKTRHLRENNVRKTMHTDLRWQLIFICGSPQSHLADHILPFMQNTYRVPASRRHDDIITSSLTFQAFIPVIHCKTLSHLWNKTGKQGRATRIHLSD